MTILYNVTQITEERNDREILEVMHAVVQSFLIANTTYNRSCHSAWRKSMLEKLIDHTCLIIENWLFEISWAARRYSG